MPDYRSEEVSRFKAAVPVEVLGLTLETEEFQTYSD
ncbi:hypothetical protein F4556_004878 [Kitasatospora gansuensis]|uniref:Uncharacterized protein n=1 Tax=Kitasatospora gansuensis TaxID=258050 RepID=A0A7W7SG85_9ACTN|nr:hypothetical protein [Kitasatospora gansuensis]